jgi:RHS repeat-associated protein
VNVYFDNIQVIHDRGALLEESHYYPFGLTMSGISSKSAGKVENKYKYNGANELQSKEFSDGNGLELYDALNRMYDPQLGRFWQVDELAESSWEISPYHFGLNNPFLFNDPLGLDPENSTTENSTPENPKMLEAVSVIGIRKMSHNKMQDLYWQLRGAGIGFDEVKNDDLRARLKRWDGIQRHMEIVHKGVKEDGMMILEVASFFIPTGWITKLKYVKSAVDLFRLRRGGMAAKAGVEVVEQVAGKVDDAASAAKSWLGEEAKVVTNKAGDNIFMSKDGLRKVRFDVKNPHGDMPHVHLEEFVNGKWVDAIPGTHRIYPKPL